MTDFIPTDDNAAMTFINHFANTIASAPAVYMLSPSDSTRCYRRPTGCAPSSRR